MKKINLSGKLNLNKTKVAELNNEQAAGLRGGAIIIKSDRVKCAVLTREKGCELTGYMEGCDTYPCCKSKYCDASVYVKCKC